VHGFLGLPFLHKTHQGIDQHHRPNDRRIQVGLQGKAGACRHQQHINQGVVKLPKKSLPTRHAGLGVQVVEAIAPQALCNRIRIQTGARVNALRAEHLLGAEGMPKGHNTLHPG
jgi:hypothetical protein